MRTKNKITQERHRVTAAQKQEVKALYFAQDPQVSSRILAVLHVEATKSSVPLYEKKKEQKEIFVYNKDTKKKEKKIITASVHKFNGKAIKEIEKFQVICGSNGKMGTWYNTISGVKDARQGIEVSEAQKFCRMKVGRKLSNTEFLDLYPKQYNAFKTIFKEEYEQLKSQVK